MTTMPPLLSKIKTYAWFALSGLGIIGTAYHLTAMVNLFNLTDSIWCSGLVMVSVFIAITLIGTFKIRHSLKRYVWMYIPVLAIIGMLFINGQSFFIGPICFGEFEFNNMRSSPFFY